MKIAVCRPQVPFARGGAEIFTDELVLRDGRLSLPESEEWASL